MDSLKVKNLGPIKEADVQFGDMTILVGPQASGKSIFLQLLKLVKDGNYIADTLNKWGYIWRTPEEFLERYFGEGMGRIWGDYTNIYLDQLECRKTDLGKVIPDALGYDFQNVFYVPAQRVLTLENGYPKPFDGYTTGDPFVIKSFSEVIRQHMESPKGSAYFTRKIQEAPFSAYSNIFYNSYIHLDTAGPKKRFLLDTANSSIPFMSWSSGQKEFMPLYIAFSLLMPSAPNEKIAYDRVVMIEEPEMGLHPAAIKSLLFAFLQMINEGYKLIISTHSPILVEFAWALNLLKKSKAPLDALYELLDIETEKIYNGSIVEWINDTFDNTMNRFEVATYYFNNKNGTVKNISSLDAFSDDQDIAEWGGLSSFASKASEIVAKNIPL